MTMNNKNNNALPATPAAQPALPAPHLDPPGQPKLTASASDIPA